MFFSSICLAGLVSFGACFSNLSFAQVSSPISDRQKSEKYIDADGLHDSEILALYNSTENEEELKTTKHIILIS